MFKGELIMNYLEYIIAKILAKILDEKYDIINKFFRKKGIRIGIGTKIYSNIVTSESFLISIGNNVTISNNVQLITHDNSVCKLFPEKTDLFGEIIIGNNNFIGARTIILPGCQLADNIIVGAGSVVTKSFFKENVIIAGNPAKVVSTWEQYADKIKDNCLNINGMSSKGKSNHINESASKWIKK